MTGLIQDLRYAFRELGKTPGSAATAVLILALGLSLLTVRVLQSQVYGVHIYDRVTLISVPLFLALLAFVASVLPTLRIASIHPADTLRSE